MKERRHYLDIGGGTHPDFFLEQSRRDPCAQYIVLDPTIRPVENKPANLHLIRWQRDAQSDIPFANRSIDKIFIHNVCYELRTNGTGLDWSDTEGIFENGYYDSGDINNLQGQIALYGQIIESCRRVLKPGGTVTIVEPAENVDRVLPLCLRHGFYVHHPPKPVPNPHKSLWTKWFHDIAKSLSDQEGRHLAQPTEFVVRI